MSKKIIQIDPKANQIGSDSCPFKEWQIPVLRCPEAISPFIPSKLKSFVRRLYYSIMNKIKFKKEHIKYSQKWYEDVYHSKDVYYLPYRNYKEVMNDEKTKHETKELLESFAEFSMSTDAKANWLEVACHHGKTPFTLAGLYENIHFYMFDFSRVAVDWCVKYNPYPDRITIWNGDIRNIKYNGNQFNNYFDVITCLDVTEHLPHNIYIKSIKEMRRVCKIGGLIVLRPGMHDVHPEHIHVLEHEKVVRDFEKRGFRKINELTNRYHVLKRIS